jgi:nucleotide-binding universal stress UspA family protein
MRFKRAQSPVRSFIGPSALSTAAHDDDDLHMTLTSSASFPRDPAEAWAPREFLVPLDGSPVAERALPVARMIATRFDAKVTVLNAPADTDDPAQDRITPFLQHLPDGSLDTVLCAASRGHREHSPCGHRDLGDRLLEHLVDPALVVGPHCSSGSFDLEGPVLVCHDGSSAADEIVAPAMDWAGALGAPLSLVHVTHPLDVESARDPRANVTRALELLGPSARFEWIRSSFPAGAIRELAREVDASVVAVSTHGRSGLARMRLGSVAAWVVRESFCPVLVARPSGLQEVPGTGGGSND